ncbi:hypothetical protein [Burkholderia sp. Bp8963]|uniref:hypothetical protein n=1 Tax=Burkholderia sp. Bp8963 TaxID=2184547 RepID=UPI000F5A3E99|nr:hypothetical protein [Burkholderia sp. Bp8963]
MAHNSNPIAYVDRFIAVSHSIIRCRPHEPDAGLLRLTNRLMKRHGPSSTTARTMFVAFGIEPPLESAIPGCPNQVLDGVVKAWGQL